MECWGFPDTLLQYPITPSLQIPWLFTSLPAPASIQQGQKHGR
jgi:hypothetical protein